VIATSVLISTINLLTWCVRRKSVTVLKPGTFCQSRFTLPMNPHVAVAVELAAHIVAVAADLDRNAAAGIMAMCIRVAVASVSADRIGMVVASNTVVSTRQISRTRWIFQVLISRTVPVLPDSIKGSLHIMYSVLSVNRSVL